MNSPVVHGLAGVAIAIGFIKGTSALTLEESAMTNLMGLASAKTARERFALHWADSLWIASSIYVLFAMRQEKRSVLIKEIRGVALYAIPALLGRARAAPGLAFWAGLGWALHPLWDLLHHEHEDAKGYVPHWYPMVCITFDIVMSAYLFNMWREGL